MDLRKTALATAVLLGLDRALWLLDQIRVLGAVPRLPWTFVVQFLFLFLLDALLLLPLPVLLASLYTTGMTLVISPRLRVLAGATALLHASFLTAPQAYSFVRELHRQAINFAYVGGTTPAAKIWEWLRSGEAGPVLVTGLRLTAGLAFLLFLVALAVPSARQAETDPLRLAPLKKFAGAAALAGAAAILLTMARQVYSAVVFRPDLAFGAITRTQLFIRDAISLMSALGWVVGALIVYIGVPRENVGQT